MGSMSASSPESKKRSESAGRICFEQLPDHARDPGRKNPLSFAVDTCTLYQPNDRVGDIDYGVERFAPWASSNLFQTAAVFAHHVK